MGNKDDLQLSDLPEPIRGYAEAVGGIENFKELARRSGGRNLYIPNEECLNKYGLKRRIMEGHCAGRSITELSEEYGISITTIYRYLKE